MKRRDNALILRDRELAKFAELLARRQFTVVVLTGRTSSGKSTLMRQVRKVADEQGWTSVPQTGQRDISVISTSTGESFQRDVNDLLDPARVSPGPLVQRLAQLQPLLMVIEVHKPAPEFVAWFARAFVNELAETEVPAVLVVVTDLPSDVRLLSEITNIVIKLGPFDSDAVARELASIGEHLSPQLSKTELDTYSSKAKNDPMVLVSLVRLLRFAAAREEPDRQTAGTSSHV
jgi:hypothetical protein